MTASYPAFSPALTAAAPFVIRAPTAIALSLVVFHALAAPLTAALAAALTAAAVAAASERSSAALVFVEISILSPGFNDNNSLVTSFTVPLDVIAFVFR